jgi:hypothetical protein
VTVNEGWAGAEYRAHAACSSTRAQRRRATSDEARLAPHDVAPEGHSQPRPRRRERCHTTPSRQIGAPSINHWPVNPVRFTLRCARPPTVKFCRAPRHPRCSLSVRGAARPRRGRVPLSRATSTGHCTTPDVSHAPIWFERCREGRRPKRDQRSASACSRPSISSASLSAGVVKPSVLRGRALSFSATSSRRC